MTTRFAIAIPQHVAGGAFDPVAFRAHMARIEELDFESAWTQEQVLGSIPNLGPLELMTYAAACTNRIRLGCAVLITPHHSPVHLAKSISTLDQLSGGRIDVGVGIGGRSRMLSAFGVDPDTLVARFNEGLQLMRALWVHDRIDFEGRFWQLRGAAMEPKPVQQPGPPVWFGASHPAALRRAVRDGDGFFGAGSTTRADFVEQVAIVRAALADNARDPGSFRIAKRVYLAIDDDADRARERIGAALQRLYGFFGLHDMTAVAVHGPPAAVVRGLRDVIEGGAELILLNPLFDDAEQMERLAAEVIPHLA